jgi:hypothetical protein
MAASNNRRARIISGHRTHHRFFASGRPPENGEIYHPTLVSRVESCFTVS